jgi:hypothetical protein
VKIIELKRGMIPKQVDSIHMFTTNSPMSHFNIIFLLLLDRLYGLVVRVPGYRSRGPDLIPGTTRLSEN